MNNDHTMMPRSAKYLQLFVACPVTALSAGILFGWQAAVIMLQQGGAIPVPLKGRAITRQETATTAARGRIR